MSTYSFSSPKIQTLVLIHVHGFKGNEQSFYRFPLQLENDLQRAIPYVSVMSRIFPAYETKGDIKLAVQQFTEWLERLAHEIENSSGGGCGSIGLVLCGHSMGGLLIAETLVSRRTPLWPPVIACIGYDSPFLGLHPQGIQQSLRQVVDQGRTVGSAFLAGMAALRAHVAVTEEQPASAGWSRWAKPAAYALGAATMVGVAGGAYLQRDKVMEGFTNVVDHMIFTGPLWDDEQQETRLKDLVRMEEEGHLVFRLFYVTLPGGTPGTFIKIPPSTHIAHRHFIPAPNSRTTNEAHGHMSMFQESTNDGYYRLVLETVKIIQYALQQAGA